MSQGPLRVAVIGDPYFTADELAAPLRAMGSGVQVTTFDVDTVHPTGNRDNAPGLREYAGDPDQVAHWVADNQVLVVHGAPVSTEAINAPHLRLVCCARGGPVNINVAAAQARGIQVTGAPGKNADAVAELTIGVILMLLRNVPASARAMWEGTARLDSVFDGREWFGRELGAAALGIVGLGNVGRRVAVKARALGMQVIAHDPYVPAEVLPDVPRTTLDDLLTTSDVVSLHSRIAAGSRPFMDVGAFARMRPGSYFVNTAREQAVDEGALLTALRTGTIAGAALDVLELPRPVPDELLMHPGVLATPHIGGATRETLSRGAAMVREVLEAYLADKPLPYLLGPLAVPPPHVLAG